MKKVVDALRDVRQAVSPSTLLSLLRGINSRFSTTGTAAEIIAGTTDMMFSTAIDQLKLKEFRLEQGQGQGRQRPRRLILLWLQRR